MKDGEGEYTWENGEVYKGCFSKDKREGLGHYLWKDGSYYKGEWSAERMHGLGRIHQKGATTVGSFKHDQFVRPVSREDLGSLASYIY